MRERTPRPAERTDSAAGPNDDAYLEYGSLSAAKSRSRGRRAGSGPRPPGSGSKRALAALGLVALPLAILVLLSLFRSPEVAPNSPAQLALRKTADNKACQAEARIDSKAGLRVDGPTRERCLIERGWKLDAHGQPSECVGRCSVPDAG